jgi:hypothetical protein
VLQWTGIPVSVGIAATKTLAMVANHRAKKTPPAPARRAVERDSVTGEIVREICAKPLPPSP